MEVKKTALIEKRDSRCLTLKPDSIEFINKLIKQFLLGMFFTVIYYLSTNKNFFQEYPEEVLQLVSVLATGCSIFFLAAFCLTLYQLFFIQVIVGSVISVTSQGIDFNESRLVRASRQKDIPWCSIAHVGFYTSPHDHQKPLGIAIQFKDNKQSAIRSIDDYLMTRGMSYPVFDASTGLKLADFRIDAYIPKDLYSADTRYLQQFMSAMTKRTGQECFLHADNFRARNI